jgi:hypothetical protein
MQSLRISGRTVIPQTPTTQGCAVNNTLSASFATKRVRVSITARASKEGDEKRSHSGYVNDIPMVVGGA